jgi:hypothetical protein
MERHHTSIASPTRRDASEPQEAKGDVMDMFTMQEFLTMIANSNARFWPVALAAYALGIGAVVMLLRKVRYASAVAVGALASFWLWTGVVFNGLLFSGLWRGAAVVAVLFVIQAALLAWTGLVKGELRFDVRADVEGIVGGLAMLYAAVGYPLVAVLTGRDLSQALLVGLAPCPTVVLTLGWLLWSRRPLPKILLVIPVLIALGMGAMAASQGMVEDFGLVVLAVVASGLLLVRDRVVGPRLRMGAQGSS